MAKISPTSEHSFKDLLSDTTQATSETLLPEYGQGSTQFTSIFDLETTSAASATEVRDNSASKILEQEGLDFLADNQNDLQQLKQTEFATLSDAFDSSYQSTDQPKPVDDTGEHCIKSSAGNLLDLFDIPVINDGFSTSCASGVAKMNDDKQSFQDSPAFENKLSANDEMFQTNSSLPSRSNATAMLDIFQTDTDCVTSNTTNLLGFSNEKQASITPEHFTKELSGSVDLLHGVETNTSNQVNQFLNDDKGSSGFSGSYETLWTEDVLIPMSAKKDTSELDISLQSKSIPFVFENAVKSSLSSESNDGAHVENIFSDMSNSSLSHPSSLIVNDENLALNGAALFDLQSDFNMFMPQPSSSVEEAACTEALVNDQPPMERDSVNNDIIFTTDTYTLVSTLEGNSNIKGNSPKSCDKDDVNCVEMEKVTLKDDASHCTTNGRAASTSSDMEKNENGILPAGMPHFENQVYFEKDESCHEVSIIMNMLLESVVSDSNSSFENRKTFTNDSDQFVNAARDQTKENSAGLKIKVDLDVFSLSTEEPVSLSIGPKMNETPNAPPRRKKMKQNLEKDCYTDENQDLSEQKSEKNETPNAPPRRKKTKQNLEIDCYTDDNQDLLQDLLDKKEEASEKPNELLLPSVLINTNSSQNESDSFDGIPQSHVFPDSLFSEISKGNANVETDTTAQLLNVDFMSENLQENEIPWKEVENTTRMPQPEMSEFTVSNSPDEEVPSLLSDEMDAKFDKNFLLFTSSEQRRKSDQAATDVNLQLSENRETTHPSTLTAEKLRLQDTVVEVSDFSETSTGELSIASPVIPEDSAGLFGTVENSVFRSEDELFDLNVSQGENTVFSPDKTTPNKETTPDETINVSQLKSLDELHVAHQSEEIFLSTTETSLKTEDLQNRPHTTDKELTLNISDQHEFLKEDQFDSNPNQLLVLSEEQNFTVDEKLMEEIVDKLPLETDVIAEAKALNDASKSINTVDKVTHFESQIDVFEQPQTEELLFLKNLTENNAVHTTEPVVSIMSLGNDLTSSDDSAPLQLSPSKELFDLSVPNILTAKTAEETEGNDTNITSKSEETWLLPIEDSIFVPGSNHSSEMTPTHSRASENVLKTSVVDAEQSLLSSADHEAVFPQTSQESSIVEPLSAIKSCVEVTDTPRPESFVTALLTSKNNADDTHILSSSETESSHLTNPFQSDVHLMSDFQHNSDDDNAGEFDLEAFDVERSPILIEKLPDVTKNEDNELAKDASFASDDGNSLHESNLFASVSANPPEKSQDVPQSTTSDYTMEVKEGLSSDLVLEEENTDSVCEQNVDVETAQPSADVGVTLVQNVLSDICVSKTSNGAILCLDIANENSEKKETDNLKVEGNSENNVGINPLIEDTSVEQNSFNNANISLHLADSTLDETLDAKTSLFTSTESQDGAAEEDAYQHNNEKRSSENASLPSSATFSESQMNIFDQPQTGELPVLEKLADNTVNTTEPVVNIMPLGNGLTSSDDSAPFQLSSFNEFLDQSVPNILIAKVAEETEGNDTNITPKGEESLLFPIEDSISVLGSNHFSEMTPTYSSASENVLKTSVVDAEQSLLSLADHEAVFPQTSQESSIIEPLSNIESCVEVTDTPRPESFVTALLTSKDNADDTHILFSSETESSHLTNPFQSDVHLMSDSQENSDDNNAGVAGEFDLEAFDVERSPIFGNKLPDVTKNEDNELAKDISFATDDSNSPHESNLFASVSVNTPEKSQDVPQSVTSDYTMEVKESLSSDLVLKEENTYSVCEQNVDVETAQPSADVGVTPVQNVLSDFNVSKTSSAATLCLDITNENAEKDESGNLKVKGNSENNVRVYPFIEDTSVEQNILNYANTSLHLADSTLDETLDAKTSLFTSTKSQDGAAEEDAHQHNNEKLSSENASLQSSVTFSESQMNISEQPQIGELPVLEKLADNTVNTTEPVVNIMPLGNDLTSSDDSAPLQLGSSNELLDQSVPNILIVKAAEETEGNDTNITPKGEESLLFPIEDSISVLGSNHSSEMTPTYSSASENVLKTSVVDAEQSLLPLAVHEAVFPQTSQESSIIEPLSNIESCVEVTDTPRPGSLVTALLTSKDNADDTNVLSGSETESSHLTNAFQSDVHLISDFQQNVDNNAGVAGEFDLEAFDVERNPIFGDKLPDVRNNEDNELAKDTSFATNDSNSPHESNLFASVSDNFPEKSQDVPQSTTSDYTMEVKEGLSSDLVLEEENTDSVCEQNVDVGTTPPSTDLDVTLVQNVLSDINVSGTSSDATLCLDIANEHSEKEETGNLKVEENSENNIDLNPLNEDTSVEQNILNNGNTSLSLAVPTLDEALDAKTSLLKNDIASTESQDGATEEHGRQRNNEKYSVQKSGSVTIVENLLTSNVATTDNFDGVANSDCSSSVFDSDNMNVSDIDSSEGDSEPKQYDNVSQISLEFDDNPFSCQFPTPPPRANKKRKDNITPSSGWPTNTTGLNTVPTTVFMGDDMDEDVAIEASKPFEDFIRHYAATEYESNTGFSEYREFVGEESDGNEHFIPFESGWDDIQLSKPSVEVMPVITEVSEPEDDYDENQYDKINMSTLLEGDEETNDLQSGTTDNWNSHKRTEMNNICESNIANIEDVPCVVPTESEEKVLNKEIVVDCNSGIDRLSVTESSQFSTNDEDYHTKDFSMIGNEMEAKQSVEIPDQNAFEESKVSVFEDVINFILDNVYKATQETSNLYGSVCNEGPVSENRADTEQSSFVIEKIDAITKDVSSIQHPVNSSEAADVFSNCIAVEQSGEASQNTQNNTLGFGEKQHSSFELEVDRTLSPVPQPFSQSDSERLPEENFSIKEEPNVADTKDLLLVSPTGEIENFPKEDICSEGVRYEENPESDKVDNSTLQANEELEESELGLLVNKSMEEKRSNTTDDTLDVTIEQISISQDASTSESAISTDISWLKLMSSDSDQKPILSSAAVGDFENKINHELPYVGDLEHGLDKSRTATATSDHSEFTDPKDRKPTALSTFNDDNLSEMNVDNSQNLNKEQITSVLPTSSVDSRSSDVIDQSGDDNSAAATEQTTTVVDLAGVMDGSNGDAADISEENSPPLLDGFILQEAPLTNDRDTIINLDIAVSSSSEVTRQIEVASTDTKIFASNDEASFPSFETEGGDLANEELKEVQEKEGEGKKPLENDLPVKGLGTSSSTLENVDYSSQPELGKSKDIVAGKEQEDSYNVKMTLEGSAVEPPIMKENNSVVETDFQNSDAPADENLMLNVSGLQTVKNSSDHTHSVDEEHVKVSSTAVSDRSLHHATETPSSDFIVEEVKDSGPDAVKSVQLPLKSSEGEDTPRTKKKLLLELDTSNDMEGPTGEISRKSSRTRHDTIGSIDLLTDSEDELDSVISPKSELSNDSILVSFYDEKEEDTPLAPPLPVDSSPTKRRRSLVPPSSLVLSVALDDLKVKSVETSSNESKLQLVNEETVGLEENAQLESVSSISEISEVVSKENITQQDGEQKIPNAFSLPQPNPPNDLNHSIAWETVVISNVDYKVDAAAIQPFKRVISHGGFFKEKSTIVEIFARYLPDSSIPNYTWVIDNLFLFLLSTMELLVQDKEYVIVFFNNSVSKSHFPSTAWLKKNHSHIPPILRKNLKGFYVVQPSFYLKTVIGLTRMFINRKAFKKLKYVKNHLELKPFIPIDFLFVPEEIARNHVQFNDLQVTHCDLFNAFPILKTSAWLRP